MKLNSKQKRYLLTVPISQYEMQKMTGCFLVESAIRKDVKVDVITENSVVYLIIGDSRKRINKFFVQTLFENLQKLF